MGDQLFLERFVWFDNEARKGRYPNASKLAEHFEIVTKSAQRSIDYFRARLQARAEQTGGWDLAAAAFSSACTSSYG